MITARVSIDYRYSEMPQCLANLVARMGNVYEECSLFIGRANSVLSINGELRHRLVGYIYVVCFGVSMEFDNNFV